MPTRWPANRIALALSCALPACALLACALLACGALSGCSPAAMTELPPGVTIDVYQSRIDYSEHKLEVAVANGTKHTNAHRPPFGQARQPTSGPTIDYTVIDGT